MYLENHNKKKVFYIDLFSGAGGTTTGVHHTNAEVIACVNHDAKAIESHRLNHPDCVHYTEDIRDFEVVKKLMEQVRRLRIQYPDLVLIIWASLECTNYSKAKGGLPRDADSRTLADHLFMYLEHLKPDYLLIENVREFMSWGPLDCNGKPIHRSKGKDYMRWVNQVKSYGFNYDYRLLNAADYGSRQARERYFGQFAQEGMGIHWPTPTHSKNPSKYEDLLENPLKPWRPVREVLDLDDHGKNIFDRKTPLVEATLERIYAGLEKFVPKGEDELLIKYNSRNQRGNYVAPGVNQPSPTVATQGRLAVVFIQKRFSGHPISKEKSIEEPTGAITTKEDQSVVFATTYYGTGKNIHSIDKPSPTVTTKDRMSLINAHFIDNQYKNGIPTNINHPVGTVTTVPKQNLVTVHQYLMNPQFKSAGRSIERPCFTLIAKMDKRPPYLISAVTGYPIQILDSDSPMTKKIKAFMNKHGIAEILMRMLKIIELKQIQGFPADYQLIGTQADQKKFIGNAVDVYMATALAKANYEGIITI